jgi:hypothetical protein
LTEFVRICPKCHALNPEYENLCQQCQQFIAMEPSVKRPQQERVKTVAQPPNSSSKQPDDSIDIEPPRPVCYLQLGGKTLTVFDQSVLGQQHPDSNIELQLDSNHAGYRYLHRQHCSFHYRDGTWYVQAINQQLFGQAFNNPTMVNKDPVAPATEHAIHHGDHLHLAAIELMVHIPVT